MFSCVLKSPVRFFDLTPNGRILNRFSKDVGNMDELLPACLIDVLWIICSVISSIVIVASGVPYMLIPAFLLGVVFFLMRSFYMKSSRAVKRSEGIARSPIFSLVGTSLEGLSTLRAFNMELKLTRLFDRQQDVHSSAWFRYGHPIKNYCIHSFSIHLCEIKVSFRGYPQPQGPPLDYEEGKGLASRSGRVWGF